LMLSIATIVTLWVLPSLKPITNDTNGSESGKR
jgi:hypothetical protein